MKRAIKRFSGPQGASLMAYRADELTRPLEIWVGLAEAPMAPLLPFELTLTGRPVGGAAEGFVPPEEALRVAARSRGDERDWAGDGGQDWSDRSGGASSMASSSPARARSRQRARVDVLNALARRDAPGIERCYRDARGHRLALQGAVTLEFSVAGDGGVERARVTDNSLGPEALGECLRRVVGAWRLPPSSASAGEGDGHRFVFRVGARGG